MSCFSSREPTASRGQGLAFAARPLRKRGQRLRRCCFCLNATADAEGVAPSSCCRDSSKAAAGPSPGSALLHAKGAPRVEQARVLLAEVVIYANLLAGDLVARGGIVAHRGSCRISRASCALCGLTMMSCAPVVPSPSPAPAPLFDNRGRHSMPAPRRTEQSSSASASLPATPTAIHSSTSATRTRTRISRARRCRAAQRGRATRS